MRIAFDASYSVDPHPSGIAIYSQELLTGLAAAHPDDRFVHAYRMKAWKSAPRLSAKNVSRKLLVPPLRTFRADVFHALNQRVDRRTAPVVISTFHDLFVMTGEYSSPAFRQRFTQQARQAAKNSDLIIAVSEFTAGQVSELLGFDRARIRVVPHGVHFPAVCERRERKMVLFVGALQKRKNVLGLVDAFQRMPNDWTLVLAGAASGYECKPILERVAGSQAAGRITVAGYVGQEQLKRLYSEASIFAFPSLDEGFGIPVLEAMAHGVPVVTSNRSALPEVAGDAALLVNPADPNSLSAALQQLSGDVVLREKLSGLGRRRAAEFSWEKAAEKTYAVYCEVAG